jgi:hypothetical protein
MNAIQHVPTLMIVLSLTAALWWAISRRRLPGALEALSVTALALAAATLAIEGLRWQLVPWYIVAFGVGVAGRVVRAGGVG